MTTKTIEFTPVKVKKLQTRYNKALVNKEEQFEFEGNQYLTTYAKHLLKHLHNVLKV